VNGQLHAPTALSMPKNPPITHWNCSERVGSGSEVRVSVYVMLG
jgi:hypothetical protein